MEQLEQLRHYFIPKFYHFKVLFLENARMQKKKKVLKLILFCRDDWVWKLYSTWCYCSWVPLVFAIMSDHFVNWKLSFIKNQKIKVMFNSRRSKNHEKWQFFKTTFQTHLILSLKGIFGNDCMSSQIINAVLKKLKDLNISRK